MDYIVSQWNVSCDMCYGFLHVELDMWKMRLLNMLLILLLIFTEAFDITNGEYLNYKQSQFMNSMLST